jgi:phosphoribosylformylglycinamidine synthase
MRGTNCENETRDSFNLVGAAAEVVHIKSLIEGYDPVRQRELSLHDFHLLAIAGGFSSGDYIRAGVVLAQILKKYLGKDIDKFIADGKPVIGICNGFQGLTQAGYLPMFDGKTEHVATLAQNSVRRFQCRWSRLVRPEYSVDDKCIWTRGVDSIDLTSAHGEGRFVAKPGIIERMQEQGQIVYVYGDEQGNPTSEHPHSPNGGLIAGVCDPTGRIFGLMPHPERYNDPKNHHLAPLQKILGRNYVDRSDPLVAEMVKTVGVLPDEGKGLKILRNGVNYVLENLL